MLASHTSCHVAAGWGWRHFVVSSVPVLVWLALVLLAASALQLALLLHDLARSVRVWSLVLHTAARVPQLVAAQRGTNAATPRRCSHDVVDQPAAVVRSGPAGRILPSLAAAAVTIGREAPPTEHSTATSTSDLVRARAGVKLATLANNNGDAQPRLASTTRVAPAAGPETADPVSPLSMTPSAPGPGFWTA